MVSVDHKQMTFWLTFCRCATWVVPPMSGLARWLPKASTVPKTHVGEAPSRVGGAAHNALLDEVGSLSLSTVT